MSTVVRFQTVLGDIDVRLYDEATPLTVANFLNYVLNGDYDDSFFHRSDPGFIIQGGGFTYDDQTGDSPVPANDPVMNEPGISNLRGTLAMAKISGLPDSATNQWFFSVDNNSQNLDNQNGGFTVFGRVIGDGMTVVDEINSLDIFNAGGVFRELPVLDADAVQPVSDANLVNLTTISILSIQDGDYDFDGDVDVEDFQIINTTFGSTTEAAADGNGTGVVDLIDLDLLGTNFGAGVATALALALAASSIPEPSTLGLASLMLFAQFARRRAR